MFGHVLICLPFSVRTTAIRVRAMPANPELAALSLGATPSGVLREITLSLVKSGVFAGGVFAFIHSFTDYSISLFLARPGTQPITITTLSFLEYGFALTLAAVAALTLGGAASADRRGTARVPNRRLSLCGECSWLTQRFRFVAFASCSAARPQWTGSTSTCGRASS